MPGCCACLASESLVLGGFVLADHAHAFPIARQVARHFQERERIRGFVRLIFENGEWIVFIEGESWGLVVGIVGGELESVLD